MAGRSNRLQKLLKKLLQDLESLPSRVALPVEEKWVIKGGELKFQAVRNLEWTIFSWWARQSKDVERFPSYNAFKKAVAEDPVLGKAYEKSGYWGQFQSILNRVVGEAAQIKRGSISFDIEGGQRTLEEFREIHTGSPLKFRAWARVIGIEMKVRSIELEKSLKLVRLTVSEFNDRQPFPNAMSLMPMPSYHRNQLAELRAEFTFPVKESNSNPVLGADGAGRNFGNDLIEKGMSAFLLAKPGRIALGPKATRGGVMQGEMYSYYTLPNLMMMPEMHINKTDAEKIRLAYKLLTDSKVYDEVMERGLHRFLLGRQRQDLVDKIVDYLIAWESLLLTTKDGPTTQELSYRFALNGASLLSRTRKLDPQEGYMKMKAAYACRSNIVHGGSAEKLKKALNRGGFDDLGKLAQFLEVSFRDTVYWLSGIPKQERPYLQQGGWEKLLWPKLAKRTRSPSSRSSSKD